MESAFRIGDIVTDDRDGDVSALIIDMPDMTAGEYAVSSSVSGATVTLADRYDRVPLMNLVYILVFDPLLHRSYPN